MEFISIFFIALSIFVISYLIMQIKSNVRVNFIFELGVLCVYIFVALIFLFPQILTKIENIFGINSAVNFIVYLSIFILYFVIFILYRKNDDLRQDITKLTRQIALMEKNEKTNKKKN